MTCFNEEITTLLKELSQKPTTETFIALSQKLVLYLQAQNITQKEIQYLQQKTSDPIHLLLSVLQSKDSLRHYNTRIIGNVVVSLLNYEIRSAISKIFQDEHLDDAVQDIIQHRYLDNNKLFPEEVQPSAKSFRKTIYKNYALDLLRKEKRRREIIEKQKEEQAHQAVVIWRPEENLLSAQPIKDQSLYLYALGTKRRLVWCIYNDMSKINLFWHDIEAFVIKRAPRKTYPNWDSFKERLENEDYPDIPTACSYIDIKVSSSQREHRRAQKTLLCISALKSAFQKDKSYWDPDFFSLWKSLPEDTRFCLQFVANDEKDMSCISLGKEFQNLSPDDIKTQLQLLRKENVTNDIKTPLLFPSKRKKNNNYIPSRISKGFKILFPKEQQDEE